MGKVLGNNLEHLEIVDGDIDTPISKRVRRKFDRHIIPWLWGMWMFSFLDRSNIGNAKIAGLSEDLNLHGTQYNLALMLFFIPYLLVDLPSNWVLRYFRAGWYLAGLIICWGLVSTFMGFVKNLGQLIACRVLMGFFEGGFIPAWRIGTFYCASPFSSAFDGLLATGITQLKAGGYNQGGATTVFGMLAFLILPHDIAKARFLTDEERIVAYDRIQLDSQEGNMETVETEKFSCYWVRLALKSITTWMLIVPYLFLAICVYAFALFLPTIIQNLGYTSTIAQLLTAPPNICGVISVLIVSRLSDKFAMRSPFIIDGTFLVAIEYALQLADYLSWLTNSSTPHYTRATSTALQQTIGNLASIVSTYSYIEKDA
ncbi:major facilitator superfamily domain-containing protein [Aspergillus novoparasiticus]|uniref:Major facilitator superfamily domain-containing protein n=1 Tax=Aspergillus novoparasiticus TaxID=986946 RepID=A0A5N6EIA0_9EURO|nr:major facilitator superfamily domain-containing protein [Aspergillus novoparasiticus]